MFNFFFKFIITLFIFNISLYAYGTTYPANTPKGLPEKIDGKYRIIERNAIGSGWYAYDLKSFRKVSDGLMLKAPLTVYSYGGGKWHKSLQRETFHNFYVPSLVSIIKNDGKTHKAKKKKEVKKLPIKRAISKIKVLDKKNHWRLKTIPNYKDKYNRKGDLICGKNIYSDIYIGVWYSVNGKVYFVNGSAKNLTKKFEATWVVPIDKSLKSCRSLLKMK